MATSGGFWVAIRDVDIPDDVQDWWLARNRSMMSGHKIDQHRKTLRKEVDECWQKSEQACRQFIEERLTSLGGITDPTILSRMSDLCSGRFSMLELAERWGVRPSAVSNFKTRHIIPLEKKIREHLEPTFNTSRPCNFLFSACAFQRVCLLFTYS